MLFLDKNRKEHKRKNKKNVNFYRHPAFFFVIGQQIILIGYGFYFWTGNFVRSK
jgi:hypothetical protein